MENPFITSPRLHYRLSQEIAIRALDLFQKADRFFGTKIYEIDEYISKSPIKNWFIKSKTPVSENSFILNDQSNSDQVLLNNNNKTRWSELALKGNGVGAISKHVLDLGNNTFTEIKNGTPEAKLSNSDLTNGRYSGLVEQEEARIAKKILAHKDIKGLKELEKEFYNDEGNVNLDSKAFRRLLGLKA